ncbi:helix-turn-helix domain-containing protein [Nocardioides caldifontis]|uniref:helix-turn-helix domain-containing protein n=1 Tax=Nocardioides caldifontis TaxID=2588938 RepID=UPI0011DF60DF|nr:XRE family transcriptional regulator [Nocardioides caldifontis]
MSSDQATADRSPKSELDRVLGQRLRELRKGKHLSLKTVAEKAAVSESFLSQVERGLVSPSVASLRRICEALDETMGALFLSTSDQAPQRLVRVADRRMSFRPDGSAHYLLTPPLARKLQVNQSVVAPGYSSGEEPYTHGGEEECVHVVQGSLTLDWATETYHLCAGDAVLIDPRIGHRFHNESSEPAVVLWMISPALGDI